jgi:hypothetical protein
VVNESLEDEQLVAAQRVAVNERITTVYIHDGEVIWRESGKFFSVGIEDFEKSRSG